MDENLNANVICELCTKCPSKYKCPRCGVNYCSILCYKSEIHMKCSENFYRDCCMSELKGVNVSKEMKQKMEDILASQSESNQFMPGNSISESLEDRLYDLSLDDTDEVWSRLNNKEKDEFYKFIESDELRKYIKCWKPWWLFEIIEEVNQTANTRVPKIQKNITPIDKLLSKAPNDLNRYSVISILMCYAYITRRYNGDHHSFTDEILDFLTDICPALFSNRIYESLESVIGSFVLNASNAKIQLNNEFLMLIIDDLFYFLKAEETGRLFIASALSDLRLVLKSESVKMKPFYKKLEFFISWITTSKSFRGYLDDLKTELEIGKMVTLRLK